MKKTHYLALCLFLLFSLNINGQTNYTASEGFEGKNLKSKHADADWFKMMYSDNPNVFKIQEAYDNYFRINPFEKSKETRLFEHWKKHIVRKNFDLEGNVDKPILNFDDINKVQKAASGMQRVSAATNASNWTRIPVRPDMIASWQSGSYTQGTCNMLAIHPTDTAQMIAAFIDGGTLWRTTNHGITWEQVATNLLCRHFGSVVYSKSNPQIVYAGSAQGVIKSTDGGANWTMTGYNNVAAYPGGSEIWAMEVKQDDPNTVLFAIGGTLYKTIDGGVNWTTKSFGSNIRDIRALPADNNVVLATVRNGSWVQVLRSTDFGTNWTSITNGYPASITGYTGELATMAVSPAAPQNVWVHLMLRETATNNAKTYDIYKSTDGGLSFSRLNITTDISDNYWQGGWNEAFGVSDTDPNLMASGSYSTWVSQDGGASWYGNGSMGKNGPHSDVHAIVIRDKTVWSIGDGGIYKSYDFGRNYIHTIDDGIQSHCLWGFDQAWKSDIMAIGMYHGPTVIRDDNVYDGWFPAHGADAGVAFVNKGDDRYIYASPWGLVRYTRSTSRMVSPVTNTISHIYRGRNDMNDPHYYETTYASNGNKIMISTDNASSFNNSYLFQNNVSDYFVAMSDNKIIYCRAGNIIMKSIDGGLSWSNVSPSSIIAGQNISHMAIDADNPSNIWVTFGGKQSVVKVGKSTDGGTTWTNYSGTVLPSYHVNCIVAQMGTNGDVYIGTESGVYYRNNTMSDWAPYNANLPLATHVNWIKINYAKAKIRIAGQTGIWESDLNSVSSPVAHPTTPSFNVQVNKPVQFADMSVALSDATYSWSFPGGTPSTSTEERPLVTYAVGGDKNVTLTVTDANGTSTRTVNNFVRVRTVENLDKTNWKVIYYDSQETRAENTPATNAIDGNYNTFWGTDWAGTNPPYPHEIQIDMGAPKVIEAFKYQGQTSNSNGDVKAYEWYVSNDGTNWGAAVATGEFPSGGGEKTVTLTQPVTARYFRFVAKSQQSGTNWCKASEISVIGSSSIIAAFTANKTLVQPGGNITFADRSVSDATSWKWSFPGGTPSSSTEQNPTVVYNDGGIYPVTLEVSNAMGTDIVSKESYITVSTFVPQTSWSVKYVDSQETAKESTAAINAFDGNNNTIWHTEWSSASPVYPHTLIVDMGSSYYVNGFNYVPRQDVSNGRIANYQFYIGNDTSSMTLVSSGTWANDKLEKSMDFSPALARFFKLVGLSEVNGNLWASAAEIKMKLAPTPDPIADFSADNVSINAGQQINFTDLSQNNSISWLWTFEGGTPSTSNVQNPTVTYNSGGTYGVTLTSTNLFGSNTVTKTNYINVLNTISYCNIQSSSFSNDYIKTVMINSFKKASVGSAYSDYTSDIIPLTAGVSNTYSLTPKAPNRTEYWSVYIDLNKDGIFSSNELMISTSGRNTRSGSFTIPSYVASGETRMRVIMKFGGVPSDACTNIPSGEIEDYTVNIMGQAQPILSSTKSIENEAVSIYSNETNIFVSNDKIQKGDIIVYDMGGHLIAASTLGVGVNAIPIGSIGVYIVKVISNENIISKKVILK